MNGLEKITARIETDAVADAARIAEEAKAQCDAIRAEGEKKAQESYWKAIRDGAKATEDRAARLAKAADMEARKSVLACKQEIVSAAFTMAEEKLLALSGEEYVSFLASLAARAAVSGKEEIILNANDHDAVGKKVVSRANELLKSQGKPAGLTLSGTIDDFAGGLILRDGDISVNCTVAALIAQARQSQASEAAAALFA